MARHRRPSYTPEFKAEARVWAGDITAIPTREGWCYLAVLLDLYSRRVVGWATEGTLDTNLVLTALRRALTIRQVRPGLMHHSDRGSQLRAPRISRCSRDTGSSPP
jgi:transposase InsO family protein